MPHIRKFTIGVQPLDKLFRLHSLGGTVVDAILALRLKDLPDDYFEEVTVVPNGRTGYRLSGRKGANVLTFTESSIEFARDFHNSTTHFNFEEVLSEFRPIWNAVNSAVQLSNVRRIGMVAECTYAVPEKSPSVWMRNHVLSQTFESDMHSDKFHLRFEERALALDGLAPDPKKADFWNTIYQFYDNSLDDTHPEPGAFALMTDAQRYFTPVISGKAVLDEILKLRKHFEAALTKMDQRLIKLGALNGKT